ncbi:hypothetical protein H5410_016433 [Solanum commersonii]|uniref:Uncharacterized protein n=1 Tax=Solanum commersonii TaxID=4109 RepID=A0A9J5ZWG5_SOLCO|nr:hypothetical protein H5410_016433 [Solanum commersonii]
MKYNFLCTDDCTNLRFRITSSKCLLKRQHLQRDKKATVKKVENSNRTVSNAYASLLKYY